MSPRNVAALGFGSAFAPGGNRAFAIIPGTTEAASGWQRSCTPRGHDRLAARARLRRLPESPWKPEPPHRLLDIIETTPEHIRRPDQGHLQGAAA